MTNFELRQQLEGFRDDSEIHFQAIDLLGPRKLKLKSIKNVADGVMVEFEDGPLFKALPDADGVWVCVRKKDNVVIAAEAWTISGDWAVHLDGPAFVNREALPKNELFSQYKDEGGQWVRVFYE